MKRDDPGSDLRRPMMTLIGFVTVLLLSAGESAADWEVYVAGGLGISVETIDTDGRQSGVDFGGEDSDSSPLIDGAIGLEIPMSEIVPREWLADVRLPDWPVRFEIEAAGLREHELKTFAGPELYFSEIKTTTVFVNAWSDIPMTSAYRPVQYLLGLGRQPRVRQWIEPASFYWGVGIGTSFIDARGTSNVLSGDDEFVEFAWNAGAGVNYALTDTVDLSAGYRFVCLGSEDCMAHTDGLEYSLAGGTPAAGDFDLSNQLMVHEVRVQIRVEVFEFLSPWR